MRMLTHISESLNSHEHIDALCNHAQCTDLGIHNAITACSGERLTPAFDPANTPTLIERCCLSLAQRSDLDIYNAMTAYRVYFIIFVFDPSTTLTMTHKG
jgi:hypothetical protein